MNNLNCNFNIVLDMLLDNFTQDKITCCVSSDFQSQYSVNVPSFGPHDSEFDLNPEELFRQGDITSVCICTMYCEHTIYTHTKHTRTHIHKVTQWNASLMLQVKNHLLKLFHYGREAWDN